MGHEGRHLPLLPPRCRRQEGPVQPRVQHRDGRRQHVRGPRPESQPLGIQLGPRQHQQEAEHHQKIDQNQQLLILMSYVVTLFQK